MSGSSYSGSIPTLGGGARAIMTTPEELFEMVSVLQKEAAATEAAVAAATRENEALRARLQESAAAEQHELSGLEKITRSGELDSSRRAEAVCAARLRGVQAVLRQRETEAQGEEEALLEELDAVPRLGECDGGRSAAGQQHLAFGPADSAGAPPGKSGTDADPTPHPRSGSNSSATATTTISPGEMLALLQAVDVKLRNMEERAEREGQEEEEEGRGASHQCTGGAASPSPSPVCPEGQQRRQEEDSGTVVEPHDAAFENGAFIDPIATPDRASTGSGEEAAAAAALPARHRPTVTFAGAAALETVVPVPAANLNRRIPIWMIEQQQQQQQQQKRRQRPEEQEGLDTVRDSTDTAPAAAATTAAVRVPALKRDRGELERAGAEAPLLLPAIDEADFPPLLDDDEAGGCEPDASAKKGPTPPCSGLRVQITIPAFLNTSPLSTDAVSGDPNSNKGSNSGGVGGGPLASFSGHSSSRTSVRRQKTTWRL